MSLPFHPRPWWARGQTQRDYRLSSAARARTDTSGGIEFLPAGAAFGKDCPMTRVTRPRGAPPGPPPETVLSALAAQLRGLGYDRVQPLPGPCAVAWGEPGGAATPRVFLLALAAADRARAGVEFVQE